MPIMIKNIFDYEYLDDEFSQKSKRWTIAIFATISSWGCSGEHSTKQIKVKHLFIFPLFNKHTNI